MDNVISMPVRIAQNEVKSPLILTVKEVAGILGVSTSLIYDLVQRHEIEHIRIGKSIRIRRSDLCVFLGMDEI